MEQVGRAHLSLIAAIAPNGRLYLAGQDSPFTGEDIVCFINKLCGRYRKRNLVLIWQGRLCGWGGHSSQSSSPAAVPQGNWYMQLRDRLGTLYNDALFDDLFPQRAQPAQSPWQLALVTLR